MAIFFIIMITTILSIPLTSYLRTRYKFNKGKCKVCGNKLEYGNSIWSWGSSHYYCENCGYEFETNFHFISKEEILLNQEKELSNINNIRREHSLPKIESYKEYKKMYRK